MQGIAKKFEQRSNDLLAGKNRERPSWRRDREIGRQALQEAGTLPLYRRHEREHLDREDRGWVGQGIEDGLPLRLLERLLRQLAAQIHRDVARDPVCGAAQARIILVSATREGRCGPLTTHASCPEPETRIGLRGALELDEECRIVVARQ